MGMSSAPIQQDLKTLLSIGKPYAIPNYQRHFTWGTEQAAELLEDIESSETDSPNFMGTMIFEDISSADSLKVVDGQQRLTTLTLLLIGIRNRAASLVASSPQAATMVGSISRYIVFSDPISGDANGFRITPSKKIEAIFNHMAGPAWDTLDDERKFPERLLGVGIKRQIKKVRPIYELFSNRLSQLNFESLKEIAKKVLDSYFYVFRVTSAEESMRLFERINARGLRLEVSDLIKTELFSQGIPDIEEQWNAVEDVAGDNPTRLLKHFYYTQGGHVSKKNLFKQMKRLPIDPTTRLKRICDFSRFYKAADLPTASAKDGKDSLKGYMEKRDATWFVENQAKLEEFFSAIISLKSFGVSQHIALVYGALNAAIAAVRPDKHCFDLLLKLTKSIEHYHFANTVVCNKGGNEVEALYARFANLFTALSYDPDCSREKFKSAADDLMAELRPKFVTESTFLSEFTQLDYENTDDTSTILYSFDRLNNKSFSFNQERTLIYRPFEAEVKRKLYTIEHIFPQNHQLSTGLASIHNIGNLVILSPGDNAKLGNKLPPDKFSIIQAELPATYALPVIRELITDYTSQAANWDDGIISNRANSLGTKIYREILKI